MRVLFCPAGVGLGHVGRCIPIARRLERDGAQVLFSTYREGFRYVEHEGFPVVEAPSIGVAVKPDGTIDFRQTTVKPGPFMAVFTFWKQVDAIMPNTNATYGLYRLENSKTEAVEI